MKLSLLFAIPALLLASNPLQAQNFQTPLAAVQSVFKGMETNQGKLVEVAFTKEAKMFTVVKDSTGSTALHEGSLAKFIAAVNSPKDIGWSEPIWNEKVEIDGDLASVWVDYAFYYGSEFLHCGVDAFHLLNTSEGWKIFHLVDTRRKNNCDVPQEIQEKYKN